MVADNPTIHQLLRKQEDHSTRLNKVEKAAGDMLKLATIVDKLNDKVNGNGLPGLDEQVRMSRRDIDRNAEDIRQIKTFIEEMRPVIVFYRVGVWLGGALGLSVLALIWGMLTGQVELSFK